MSVKGAQLFLQTGARFLFQRDTTVDDRIDLGVVTTITPTYTPTQIFVKDPYGGFVRTVDSAVSEIAESYDLVCNNMNDSNLALIFGSAAPTSYVQSATPVTAVVHHGSVGSLFGVHNAAGIPVFSIASIQAVRQVGSNPYALVLGEDYEIADADQGTIRLLAGGTTNHQVAGVELRLEVDYTLTAISGNRLILPQTVGVVDGRGYVFLSGNQGTQKHVRYADVSLTLKAMTLSASAFSDFTLNVTILSDPVAITEPAGRLIHFKGALPATS